jgi:exodeoxyribonuclease VII large subunit
MTFSDRARVAIGALLAQRDARLERAERLLIAVSYRGVLERGFALVRGTDGKPLRTAAAVATPSRLDIEFSDGRVRALAEAKSVSDAPPPRRRRRGGGGSGNEGQGSLFGA